MPRDNVVGQWAALYVSMNELGEIKMSRVTYQKIGSPEAFVVLFDPVNNRIGLRPAAKGTRNAYRAGVEGQHGGRVIRAFRMMQEFRIGLSETIRFHDAEIDEDGVLVLDLRTARVSTKALGYWRNRNHSKQQAASER